MFIYNNQPINIFNSFTTSEGITYPNLLDSAIREQLGIVEVPDPPTYDQRFYWDIDIPKQLEDQTVTDENGQTTTTVGLKTQWTSEVKRTCNQLLSQTDWTIIRKTERDIPIPNDIVTFRTDVLAECERLESSIESSTTIEEFINVVTSQNWPNLSIL